MFHSLYHESIGCCRQTELCHPSVRVLGLVSTSRDELGEAWKESPAIPPPIHGQEDTTMGFSTGTSHPKNLLVPHFSFE